VKSKYPSLRSVLLTVLLALAAFPTLPACEQAEESPRSFEQLHAYSQMPAHLETIATLRHNQADVLIKTTSAGDVQLWIDLGLVEEVGPAIRLVTQLPNVVRLNLQEAKLSSSDFEQLGTLRDLRWLDLSNSTVQNADLEFIEAIPKLEFLLLANTAIGDAAVPRLCNLSRLQKLDLSGTRITSASLEQLAMLRELLEVFVEVPSIDEADVERLRQNLPDTLIVN